MALKDFDSNEYINYSFKTDAGGTYDFNLRYSSCLAGSLGLKIYDQTGTQVHTSSHSLAATGTSTSFSTYTSGASVTLLAGTEYLVQLESGSDDLSIDWFSIGIPNTVPAPAPVFKKQNNNETHDPAVPVYDISVFPNPTEGLVNIEISQNEDDQFTYQLFSIKGELIRSDRFDKATILDISKEASGTYVLKIYDESGTKLHTHEIIKE